MSPKKNYYYQLQKPVFAVSQWLRMTHKAVEQRKRKGIKDSIVKPDVTMHF